MILHQELIDRIIQLEITLQMCESRIRFLADGGELSLQTFETMLKQIQRVMNEAPDE